MQLLQLAKRDIKIEEEKENRVNVVTILDGVKKLTPSRLYRSGEVVLGSDCLRHI